MRSSGASPREQVREVEVGVVVSTLIVAPNDRSSTGSENPQLNRLVLAVLSHTREHGKFKSLKGFWIYHFTLCDSQRGPLPNAFDSHADRVYLSPRLPERASLQTPNPTVIDPV
jgi:hypothetical protein